MIIKKFQGKTKEEALENAKKELGDGLVEMNVKTVKSKGFLGLFQASKVEVTVAKEEENEKYNYQPSEVKKEGVAVSLSGTVTREETKNDDFATVGKAVSDILASHSSDEADTKKTVPAQQPSDEKAKELGEKLDNLQSLLEKQLSQQEGKAQTDEQQGEGADSSQDSEKVNFLKLLYNKMIENEIDEKYANEIINDVDKSCKQDATLDFMLSEVYQRMILKLGKTYCIEDGGKKPRVVFFVGPTGVGKTTTIAKIASSYRVEHKKKVAMLTADTYRIAAAEQLRTYANILEIPFRVVYSAEEIAKAVESFKDYDYILVDTTGHSPNNEAQCESMSALIGSADTADASKEVFLVLSASTKYRDLVQIADTYKGIADYKLIFTKLDETSTLGNIYNLRRYTGAPLSYVTFGQNVPDDIEYFDPQATVKSLLGGRR